MLVKIESFLDMVQKVEVTNHEEVDFDESPNYGDKPYWNERYEREKDNTFDWLGNWSEIRDLIFTHTITEKDAPNAKILNLGCGNSIMAEDMYDEGIQNIYNIDYSDIVIKTMKERNEEKRPNMVWEEMDVRDLKYENEFFDLVIDKSTLDCISCADDSVLNIAKMVKECQRVLKPGGFYVVISYGLPNRREYHFDREFLDFKLNTQTYHKTVEDSDENKTHYAYICKKGPDADFKCKLNYKRCIAAIEKGGQ